MLKRHPISNKFWSSTIYAFNRTKRKEFLTFFWRSNRTFNNVTCFQAVLLNLSLRNVNIIRRRKIIIVRRTQKAVTVRHNFQNARTFYYTFKIIYRLLWLLRLLLATLLSITLLACFLIFLILNRL